MLLFEVLPPLAPELFWILCVAFVIAFLLAFSVGANDVSNSFGTSVGSRVLTVTQACILATIFEVTGATLLGYSVCDTFRRNVYNVDLYEGAQKELMLGALACLIGSSIWNIVATFLKMPISGTHSIVGATIGFSVVSRGWSAVRWYKLAGIVGSWFASPILSGLISASIYALISKTIICKIDPLRYGLKALPLFYGATIFINVASIVIDGPEVFGLNTLPWYAGLFIALMCASITICCVALILVPRLKREILDELVARKAPPPSSHRTSGQVLQSITQPPPPPPVTRTPSGAYDNVTFAPEVVASPPPGKPKREMSTQQLDASQLVSKWKSEKVRPAPPPPVAPKPAHLRPGGGGVGVVDKSIIPMDEIDLSTSGKSDGTNLQQVKRHPDEQVTMKQQVNSSTSTGERYEVAKLFSSLQILTACFASFAHGTNDVSNAVAPLIPIWNIYATGSEDVNVSTQVWILAFGSIGICTGLWAWGRAVMSTISDGLTKITPSKGFSIELGAAVSVLIATKLGLPISTTHCKVGSLVVVGFVSSKFLSQDNLLAHMSDPPARYIDDTIATDDCKQQELQIVATTSTKNSAGDEAVDWKLFGNIALTWVSTVPLAALASACVMYLLQWLVL